MDGRSSAEAAEAEDSVIRPRWVVIAYPASRVEASSRERPSLPCDGRIL
jgi:hypothetical protein